jgi:hypothetical protein
VRTALVLTFLALAGLAWYAAACWLAPFRACRRCGGMGRIRPKGLTGRARRPRPCRRCKTTGLRLRAGRHVFNYLAATRTAARNADRAQRPAGPTPPRTRTR